MDSTPLGSRYRLLRELGHGAMGVVWSGEDDTGRPFAFKLLHPHLARDPGVVRRFIGERDLLTNLHHPNVVQVEDLVVEGGTLAIVMELVSGGDLRGPLESRGTLMPGEVCRLGAAICDGLAAIHDHQICHRDIKPENVLLEHVAGVTVPKISDFGVSKLVEPDETHTTMLTGTPSYLAPEVVDGGQPGVASDIYALGIMLYELCCGVTPFQGPTAMAVLKAHVERLPGRPPGMPTPIWDLVRRMLEKDPGLRPGSARDVAAELRRKEPEVNAIPAAPRLTEPPPTEMAQPFADDRTYIAPWVPSGAQPGATSAPPWDSATMLSGNPAGSGGQYYSGASYPPQTGYPQVGYPQAGFPQASQFPPGQYPPYGMPPPYPGPPTQPQKPKRSGTAVALIVLGVVLIVGVLAFGGMTLLFRRGEPAQVVATTATTTPASTTTSATRGKPTTSATTLTTPPISSKTYVAVTVTVENTYGLSGTGDGWVAERSGPHGSDRLWVKHGESTSFVVVCQVTGTRATSSVLGQSSNVWSKVRDGGYVANIYLRGIDKFHVQTPC